MQHETIPLLSMEWWVGIAVGIAIVGLAHRLFLAARSSRKPQLAAVLGWAILAEVLLTHGYLFAVQGTWSLADSLPLHLCRFSFIGAGVALITRHQFLYEWSVYLGLPSGLHSLLTPELTQGDSAWMLFDYYFSHSLLVAVPIVLSSALEMRPTRRAILKVFAAINLLAIVIGPLNFALDSNYMYLAEKPIAENPFLIGPWPWYIIGLEFVILLHMALIDVLFRMRPWPASAAQRIEGQDGFGDG